MTRKDYVEIAAAFAATRPERLPVQYPTYEAWQRARDAVADALSMLSGYDAQGNRAFRRDLFVQATEA